MKDFPTLTETKVLRILLHHDTVDTATVAFILGLHRSSGNTLLNRLFDKGCVTWEYRKTDKRDKALIWSLTPFGESLANLAIELGIGDS